MISHVLFIAHDASTNISVHDNERKQRECKKIPVDGRTVSFQENPEKYHSQLT